MIFTEHESVDSFQSKKDRGGQILLTVIPCYFGGSFWAGKKTAAAFCNLEDACGECHQLCTATFDQFYLPSSMGCELL